MNAVLRVVLEAIEFSSCGHLDRLERFEATSSFLNDLFFGVSAVTFRSDEFRRLRLRLLGGGDDVETALLIIIKHKEIDY